jgi:thiamine biosynthesis lipoprotein ApbE
MLNKANFLYLFLCCMFILAGCKGKKSENSDANDVKKEISQAVDATGDYLKKQKEATVESAKKTYDQLAVETKQLISKIKTSGNQGLVKMTSELENKLDVTEKKFQELKESGKDTWQDTQNAFNTAAEELKQAYNKTKAEFEKSDRDN